MDKDEYNKLVIEILKQVEDGTKIKDVISNFIARGFLYKDIESALNYLINIKKIDGKDWGGDDNALMSNRKKEINRLEDKFSNSETIENINSSPRFKMWLAVNKKALIEFSVGIGIVFLVAVISYIVYWNSPEKKLYRAFQNSFGSETIGYNVSVDGNKYDKNDNPLNNYDYIVNVSGSVVMKNFSGGLKLNETDTKSGEKIKEEEAQMIITGIGSGNNYFELDKYAGTVGNINSINNDVFGKWIEGDDFVELRKIINIGIDNIFLISSNITNLNSDSAVKMNKYILDGRFLNNAQSVESDDENFSKIVFSINPVFASDLSYVLDKIAGYGVVGKQWIIDASWSAYVDNNKFIRRITIKPEANKNLGRVKINKIVINLNPLNNKVNISKPNNFITEKDIINKIKDINE